MSELRFNQRQAYAYLLRKNLSLVAAVAQMFDEYEIAMLRCLYGSIPTEALNLENPGQHSFAMLLISAAYADPHGGPSYRFAVACKTGSLSIEESQGLHLLLEALKYLPNWGPAHDGEVWWHPIKLLPALEKG